MTRSARSSLGAALAAVALGAAATACGPSAPALTDPTEIVMAGVRSTASARSVHIDMTVDGSITADLSGTGEQGVPLPLTGTTAAADIDIANNKARATFAIPAFLNLNGEIIQVGDTSYVRTSLGGERFERQEASDSLPVDPTDTANIVEEVGTFLAAEGVDPVKGDDVDCGGTSCYSVQIELTPEELAALGGGPVVPTELPLDVAQASVTMTIRVEKDTQRLSGLTITLSLGEQGSVTATVTFTNWDQPVNISAPPDDQIEPGT